MACGYRKQLSQGAVPEQAGKDSNKRPTQERLHGQTVTDLQMQEPVNLALTIQQRKLEQGLFFEH